MEKTDAEREFEGKAAEIRERLRQAREEDDPFLVANLESQLELLKAGASGRLKEDAEREAEFDQRLDALKDRAGAARGRRDEALNRSAARTRADGEATRGLGVGLAIAYSIIGVPVFGFFVGWLLESQAGLAGARSYGAMLGVVLGMIGALVMLQRQPK